MEDDLSYRAGAMLKSEKPLRLFGVQRSIHFLRGVASRASMSLPAFYYFLGAKSTVENIDHNQNYELEVARSYSGFSDLNTVSLACRKIFDHSVSNDLTGANFGKTKDNIISEHARYWSDTSERSVEECEDALLFLREVFQEYAKTDQNLLIQKGDLAKRIGLLKQHADREAAHLSLENYSLDILDIAHFTAAIVICGEIIRSFDSPLLKDDYFDELDLTSYQVAKRVFPSIKDFRLFKTMEVSKQARSYWKLRKIEKASKCLDQLQWALG